MFTMAAGDWEVHPGYRVRALEVASSTATGFALVDPKTSGITFTNVLGEEELIKDSSLLSGSGVALGDIDGDGLCDIYFCSLAGRNALYRNLGHWHFEEIAEQAGVSCPGEVSRGAVFADINGDGALDLLVTSRGGGVRCFLNDGKGRFHETTAEAGLATNTGSLSLALADVDGNGSLDLYVANFGVGSVLRDGGNVSARMVNGKLTVVGRMAKRIRIVDGKFVEYGEPDVLYLNDGQGHFAPVPWEQGAFVDEKGRPVETPLDFGLSVQMRDLNGDGAPDIYVCNDFFTPDRIWMNDGHGHFRAIHSLAIRKSSYAAMGVDFADIDRDGHPDAVIVEMLARDPALRLRQITPDIAGPPNIGDFENRPQTGRNTLLWNRGDGTFAEIAYFAGVAASDWSWTPIFLDVDLDGFEDLLISAGQGYDLLDADAAERSKMRDPRANRRGALSFPRIEVHNCAFRNRGDRTFTESSAAWGFNSTRISNGMALADLDNDGGLDMVINCLNASPLLYRNLSGAPRVAVRLKGLPPNTQGIGALITVRGGAVPFQSQEIVSGGRFLSGDDPMRVFAAGSMTNHLRLEVAWRSGAHSVVEDALPNYLYEIDESAQPPPKTPVPVHVPPLFDDATQLLGHTHHEEPFDDFALQPLLPKRLSQLGPGVAWCDLRGDGREDLIIGSGRNGRIGAYRWDGKGFRVLSSASSANLSADSAGMASCTFAGHPALLIGLSNYELRGTNIPPLWRLTLDQGSQPSTNLKLASTNLFPCAVGPLAVGDWDGNGRLEVFVGGRVIPGHYPEAAPSFLLRQQADTLAVDTDLSSRLARVGLVSGAVFSDLDGDGLPELILACEWGAPRIFRNAHGELSEWNPPLRFSKPIPQIQNLNQLTGLWQSVTTGDFDGDGRIDIVIGNWGLNSANQAEPEAPLVLYYGDFNGEGAVGILETMYDLSSTTLLPRRDWRTLSADMPFILERIPNHRAFSQAGIRNILGDRFGQAQKVQANTLASVVLLNRGDWFEVRPLPPEAQWAPVFGICVGDLDGDGREDVILAQNFFDLPSESARLDAGRALLLKGDGRGGFKPIPGQESGLMVYGEQRGCALGDYDGDGRVDLVISQNGAATRLFHNLGAKPGLRIRLRGPANNPCGTGAQLRIGRGGKFGPARELHAGSGYWSQDSAIPVMAAEKGDQVWIRWPGGKTNVVDIPDGARAIEIAPDGLVPNRE